MAIDTAEKRKSISGLRNIYPGVTPNASKDQEWRQEAGWKYSGILATSSSVVVAVVSLGELSVLQISELERNILSVDFGNNVIRLETETTILSMSLRMGMWGEAMFGDDQILGGALSSIYSLGSLNVRNI